MSTRTAGVLNTWAVVLPRGLFDPSVLARLTLETIIVPLCLGLVVLSYR